MDDIMTVPAVAENKTEVKPQKKKDNYKIKSCKVIKYDKKSKILDILFDNYGLRFKNVNASGNTVEVKYKGTIGNKDFEYFLSR